MYLRITCGILLSALLSGCGLHALQQSDKPATLTALQVNSQIAHTPFVKSFKRRLAAFNIAQNKAQGDQLNVLKLSFSAPQKVAFNSGISQLQTLKLTLLWQLKHANGKAITAKERLVVTQHILKNPNQFNTPTETITAYRRMSDIMANRLLIHLFTIYKNNTKQGK